MSLEIQVLSSLEKVFSDEELRAAPCTHVTALRGERVSFQIACRCAHEERLFARAKAVAACGASVEFYDVGQVPVAYPCFQYADDNYLRRTPGLYPDPLFPHTGELRVLYGQWRSLWVSLVVPADAPAGESPVSVELYRADGEQELLARAEFCVEIIPAALPPQTLIHTEWFHADCLATWYGVPVFSEEHWRLLGAFMRNAAAFGVNLLLTPVFTPPLDTQVGGERPTVQLVEVEVTQGAYRFGFSRLDRYMDLAESCGIRLFEISHLFTQWGAKHAPKIVASVDGEEKRIFGWETAAMDPAYTAFLRAFLQALRAHLTANGRFARCRFHVSDEPTLEQLDTFRPAADFLRAELPDCIIMDALSEYEFYENGTVSHPIPAIDHLEPFLAHDVPHLWTYYCCGQKEDVSNRFMSMPLCRTRILGAQLYKYRIEGFLQWGFNFWYSQYSRHAIDPFAETGAEDSFPAGDAYLVYPGRDGNPIPSLREFAMLEALQDLRALQLLETVLPHDEVVALLEQEGTVALKQYPCTAAAMLAMRERVNRKIQELMG